MKRTTAEILNRIARIKDDDWMGTQTSDLMGYLPFEQAKPFLKDGVTEQQWAEQQEKEADPIAAARDYLGFAWGKANNCRGLSAGRSLDHFKAWLWLAGHDAIVKTLQEDYDYYGKPQLVMVSTLLDFDWRKEDNGEWVRNEDEPSISPARIAALVEEFSAKAVSESK